MQNPQCFVLFFKLLANYQYRKRNNWEFSKNHRYRKMYCQFHPISSIESNVPNISKEEKTVYWHDDPVYALPAVA